MLESLIGGLGIFLVGYVVFGVIGSFINMMAEHAKRPSPPSVREARKEEEEARARRRRESFRGLGKQ
jgi:hypothetical protein